MDNAKTPEPLPTFEAPSRLVRMANGEQWQFRFDNRALYAIDAHFGGQPDSSFQMYYALSASHRHRNGIEVSFEEFLDLLPPLMSSSETRQRLESLFAEVTALNNRMAPGNAPAAASPILPPPDGAAATTTAE